MSFSQGLKEELSKENTLKDKEVVKAELIGYLGSNNSTFLQNRIKFTTENQYTINRFNKLLKNLDIDFTIDVQGKVYSITLKKWETEEISYVGNQILFAKKQVWEQEKQKRAFVRGAFMGSGSISDPNKRYHLEIVLPKENIELVYQTISSFGIQSKTLARKETFVLYMKDGEEISKFLALLGANNSVLKFEEIRVLRDMKNNINRVVNCETANLNKIINTSVKQIRDIQYLQEIKKFDILEEGLKEIAVLRIKNPDISLAQLGVLLKEPIGKSGVNHRLKKIEEIAKEWRKEKE